MCQLADKTPSELNAMTKADIIAEILDGVTRSSRAFEHDAKGNPICMEETTTDAYGEVLGIRIIDWAYYATGEVDEITITDDKERLVVKHYTDGRQPIAIKKPMPKEL